MSTQKRFWLLLACASLGIGIGVLGQHFTGHDSWFLAVPACVALVWLAIADPSRCARCEDAHQNTDSKNGS